MSSFYNKKRKKREKIVSRYPLSLRLLAYSIEQANLHADENQIDFHSHSPFRPDLFFWLGGQQVVICSLNSGDTFSSLEMMKEYRRSADLTPLLPEDILHIQEQVNAIKANSHRDQRQLYTLLLNIYNVKTSLQYSVCSAFNTLH